jgi:hypothetical protein
MPSYTLAQGVLSRVSKLNLFYFSPLAAPQQTTKRLTTISMQASVLERISHIRPRMGFLRAFVSFTLGINFVPIFTS